MEYCKSHTAVIDNEKHMDRDVTCAILTIARLFASEWHRSQFLMIAKPAEVGTPTGCLHRLRKTHNLHGASVTYKRHEE
ncbi:MAG: hypothetical protein NTY15_12485 [Planctomycetota bacterium]|nr:hypothetical protein [Planctomycetota bacterium]